MRVIWEKPFKADMGWDSPPFPGGGLVNPGRFGGMENPELRGVLKPR